MFSQLKKRVLPRTVSPSADPARSHAPSCDRPDGRRVDIFDLSLLLGGESRRLENEALIRATCASCYLHDTNALCRVLGRYKMFVDTTDVGFSTHMMLDGYWEMWVTEAMADLLRPGMTTLDCGANLGYYTLIMADLVGPEGQVHAFEPNPEMARRLRQTIDVNGFAARVAIHETALADFNGEMLFLLPTNEPKNGRRVPEGYAPAEGEGALLRLPTRTIDDILDGRNVDFIKIDVEGAEETLWRGMSRLLDQGRPLTIFLEYASDRYSDPAAFLDEIEAHGFRLAQITASDGVQPMERKTILAAPSHIDQMLALSR